MKHKIAKLAREHVAQSFRDWVKGGFQSNDSSGYDGEYSGTQGPKAAGVPRNLAEALRRNRELADYTSSEFFQMVAPSYTPGVETFFDPNTQPFTGPDGRSRSSIPSTQTQVETLKPAQPDDRYLQVLVKHYMPKIIDAYKRVRHEKPELRPLAVEWDSQGLVPEESIARHHSVDGRSRITIKVKAYDNLNYLEWVVKHELIHYLLNTPDELDDHGLEFQLMSEMLSMPTQYRD